MRVISVKKLRDFYRDPANPKAEGPLLEWYAVVKKANWERFSDIKATYNSVDQVGSKAVFNVGGNRIRIIAVIDFVGHKVFVRFVLDHQEYDKGHWKNDRFA